MNSDFDTIIADTREGRRKTIAKLLEDETPQYEVLRASIRGDVGRVLALVAADRSVIDVQSKQWTPLQLAVEYGRLEVARALIDRGASMDAPAADFQSSLLHPAAERGHA